MKEIITQWFHMLANEGLAITQLRNEYETRGIYLTAHKAELIIKLKILKEIFLLK